MRYLARKKAMTAPMQAPTKLDEAAKTTPGPRPKALEKATPLPRVKIDGGIKTTVTKTNIMKGKWCE